MTKTENMDKSEKLVQPSTVSSEKKIQKTKKTSGKVPLHQIQAFCITCETKHQIWTTLEKDLKIDVCSQCHPFYLGKQKFESKAGRMERFRQIAEKSAALKKPKTSNSEAKPSV